MVSIEELQKLYPEAIAIAEIELNIKPREFIIVVNRPIMDIKLYKELDIYTFIIPKKILELDVKYSVVGEHIAESLLFPFRTLKGHDYLLDLAYKYRQRVIIEVAKDLATEFTTRGLKSLLNYLLIPPEYFVLKKISERIYLYPIRVSMYKSLNNLEILRKLKSEYKSLLDQLAQRGYFIKEDGYYILSPELIHKKYLSALKYKLTTSIFTALGFATRAIKDLLRFNISLLKDIYTVPEFTLPEWLKTPENLLKLKHTELFFTTPSILKRSKLISRLGALSSSELRLVNIDGCEHHVIVKRFAAFTSTKWIAASILGIPATRIIASPGQRLANEYIYTMLLKGKGFCVPKIYAVILDSYMLVKEYMEGKSLIKIADSVPKDSKACNIIYKLGKLLAEIHKNNVAIGDSKFENFILKNGNICIVDLEQAREASLRDKAWDIAEMLYFLAFEKQIRSPSIVIECARLIASGYVNSEGDLRVLKEATKPRYFVPFIGFINPQLARKVINVLKNVSKSSQY